jgi:transcriptional regulator with XRE-family HTH domain
MTYKEKNNIKWRKVRLSMDLSQRDFGQKLGVGAGYISEIESGKKEPSHTLSELFRYIYIEASESIDNIEQKPISNIGNKENESLQEELIIAYRKIIERDETIFKLTQELVELKETSSLKTIKSS